MSVHLAKESIRSATLPDVPKITISLGDREYARLQRLAHLRGTKFSRAIGDSVTHTLATIELRRPVEVVVPSEQEEKG